MTNDLDPEIKYALSILVDAAPDAGPLPIRRPDQRQKGPDGRLAFAVAAAVLISVVVGAALYLASAERNAPASVVVGPVLLQPASDSDVQISNREFFSDTRLEVGGAVVAPDGTVFGLIPVATQTLDTVPSTYEERTIAGLQTWAAEDGTAPTQVRRGIEIGCGTLSVTTGQGPMWPTALNTLAGVIEANDNEVIVQLPQGWQSLGSATSPDWYSNTLTVPIGRDDVQLRVRQAIGQPVGMFLSAAETNPIDISTDNQTMWHVAGGTTPTSSTGTSPVINTLVTVRNQTLVQISGGVPLDVLVDVASKLEPVPTEEWLDLGHEEVNDNPSMTIEGTEAVTCEQRTLTIIE